MSASLPLLRPDLTILSGPVEQDGAPTLTVLDPATGHYRQMGWAAAQILMRLHRAQTPEALQQLVEQETTLRLDPQELALFCQQARQEHLTRGSAVGDAQQLYAVHQQQHPSLFQWLLTHYLYIRIPLCHPDQWLTSTVHLFRRLISTTAIVLWAMAFLVGVFRLTQNFDQYAGAFPGLLNLQGAGLYLVAILVLKLIHEFSHAFVAKHFGVRVPSMGVALMVFAPVAWCDVTDAWRLSDRRQRFWISAAGLCAELVIAGLALFVWGVSDNPNIQRLAVVLSSATLASTLLVNINPALRFDGYYILSDLWGIDNLRARAFAMTRWALWRGLLGIPVPPPESDVPRRRLVLMIVYSLYSWMYRIGLYVGIAILVYYKFTKLIGLTLFAAEIYLFMVRPAIAETQRLMAHRSAMTFNRRLQTTLFLSGMVFLWLALPLPRRLALPAAVVPDPASSQTLYAPFDGTIQSLPAQRNTRLKPDDLLISIVPDRLETDRAILQQEKLILEQSRKQALLDPDRRSHLQETENRLGQVDARLDAIAEQVKQSRVTSEISGLLYDWNPNLHVGMVIAQGTLLGHIADTGAHKVAAFCDEDDVTLIRVGDSLWFQASDGYRSRTGTVEAIAPRAQHDQNQRASGLYQLTIRLQPGPVALPLGQTGKTWGWTRPRSHLVEVCRSVWRTLIRESGF